MAKKDITSVNELNKYLTKEKLLPVYFIFGEDHFASDSAINAIQKFADEFVESDFDREIINAEKSQNISQILDLAYSFPFGGGKKLIVIKNFEKLNEKKEISKYLKNPPEFTILVIASSGKINDFSREPYSILYEKKYLFEARVETGAELINWILKRAKNLKINFNDDLGKYLVEVVGEDKALLEMQLQKIADYSIDEKELTYDDLKKIASPTKQYSIFDLQDSMGKGDKPKSLEIAFKLLDSGQEIIVIINMLSKYLLTIAQITEVGRAGISDNEAAKMCGVSWFYYINCKKAHFFMKEDRLLTASRSLLQADLAVKTSSADPKSIMLVLISEMMN